VRKERTNAARAEEASLTTGDIARKHHTTSEQVRRWIQDGDLVAIRRKNFIRVRPEALADFERRFTVGDPNAVVGLGDLRSSLGERVDPKAEGA
jgi:hypothetical protein